jgi:hypothetical protein
MADIQGQYWNAVKNKANIRISKNESFDIIKSISKWAEKTNRESKQGK